MYVLIIMFFGKSNSHGGFFKKGGGAGYFLKHVAETLESPHIQSVMSALSPTMASVINVAKAGGVLERLKHY